MREWQKMADRLRNSSDNVTIGIVGKYVELQDASLSIMEALRHGGVVNGLSAQIRWIGEENAVSSGASQQARQTASAFSEIHPTHVRRWFRFRRRLKNRRSPDSSGISDFV